MKIKFLQTLVACFSAAGLIFTASPAHSTEERESRQDMVACANLAVELALYADRVRLDFSVKSLEYVDRTFLYFRTLPIEEDQRDTVVGVFGCYVGEVLIRSLGGAWYFPSVEEQAPIGERAILKFPGGLVSNPIGKVRKLMHNGIEDSVVNFHATAQALLHQVKEKSSAARGL